MSSRRQGDLAEQIAILHYTKLGHLCSTPVTHSKYYDLIVDRGGPLVKVEVKSSSNVRPSGNYEFALSTSGGNKTGSKEHKRISASKVDLVFLVGANGDMYELKASQVENKKAVTLSPTMPEYIGNFYTRQY